MRYSNEAAGNVKQLFLTLCFAPDPAHSGRGLPESGVSGWHLRRPCPVDSGKNLVLFRKTKLFQFREHQCPVDTDFESPTAALNEPGCNPVLILNRVLQTCSIWKVESLSTIFYRDIHTRSLLACKLEKWTHRVGTRHSSHFPRGRQATRAGPETHHGVAAEGDRRACSGRRLPRQLP